MGKENSVISTLKKLDLEECFEKRKVKREIDYKEIGELRKAIVTAVCKNEEIRQLSAVLAEKNNF